MPTNGISLPNNWSPRVYQKPACKAWLAGTKRFLLIWHRRAGKDDIGLHLTAVAAHPEPPLLPNQRIGNYWHCLPQYEQARKAIWEAVNPHSGKRRIDEAFPLELRKRTDNQSMTIEFLNGSIWKLVGSDDPDSLVGAPPVGIVFSEWAISNPSAWGYLAPILAENDGWAMFITTPRGRNHAHAMFEGFENDPKWFVERLSVHETGFSELLVDEQRKEYVIAFGQDAGDALIEQEYYCNWEAAILGAVWGREMADVEKSGRIARVPVDTSIPIHTAWDIGKGLNMAVWVWQQTPDQIRVIDFLKGFGEGFPSFVAELERRGYTGGTDWVPHDARVKELGTEKTRLETLIELKRNPRVVPNLGVADGINAARVTLPRVWFDKEACKLGLEALRQYRAEWDDKKKCFKDTQVKDWTTHPADAFRYLCLAWREIRGPAVEETLEERIMREHASARVVLDEMKRKKTLNEMLDEYDAERGDE